MAIKLPSRRELTVLVPLTQQQQDLYRQMLCSLDSQTLEIVMRDTSSSTDAAAAAALLEPSDGRLSNDSAESPVDPPPPPQNVSSSSAGQDTDWRQLMNLLLQLRKVCNHTYLLPDVAPEPYEVNEDIVRGSGKLMVSTQPYRPLSPSLLLAIDSIYSNCPSLSMPMWNHRCWIGCCHC